jgi:hypothetical protein
MSGLTPPYWRSERTTPPMLTLAHRIAQRSCELGRFSSGLKYCGVQSPDRQSLAIGPEPLVAGPQPPHGNEAHDEVGIAEHIWTIGS